MRKRASLKTRVNTQLLNEVCRIACRVGAKIFRSCLDQVMSPNCSAQEYDALMKRLEHIVPGRRFSREEMNER